MPYGGAQTTHPWASAVEQAFVERKPGSSVELGLGHSPSQVVALEQGAPADVIATASDIPMGDAARRGLLAGAPQPFARNRLQIVVAAGNPENIRNMGDLTDPELTVLLPDPQVPAGRLAQQALRTAGRDVVPDDNVVISYPIAWGVAHDATSSRPVDCPGQAVVAEFVSRVG